jgi:lipoprotein NlpI
MGSADEAHRLIAEYSNRFKGQEWQTSLLQYYLGKADEAEIISKTRHRCDRAVVSFYLGCDNLVKGDRQKAAEYFQSTIDANVPAFRVSAGARAGLRLLDK